MNHSIYTLISYPPSVEGGMIVVGIITLVKIPN